MGCSGPIPSHRVTVLGSITSRLLLLVRALVLMRDFSYVRWDGGPSLIRGHSPEEVARVGSHRWARSAPSPVPGRFSCQVCGFSVLFSETVLGFPRVRVPDCKDHRDEAIARSVLDS